MVNHKAASVLDFGFGGSAWFVKYIKPCKFLNWLLSNIPNTNNIYILKNTIQYIFEHKSKYKNVLNKHENIKTHTTYTQHNVTNIREYTKKKIILFIYVIIILL